MLNKYKFDKLIKEYIQGRKLLIILNLNEVCIAFTEQFCPDTSYLNKLFQAWNPYLRYEKPIDSSYFDLDLRK